jgi:hypothetical protein
MNKPIYENEKYRVEVTHNALGEDNKYGRRGYSVVNKETDVIEHTTTMLPQALFQADALAGALSQLDEQAEISDAEDSIIEDSVH